MTGQQPNSKRRFSFSLLRLILALTVVGAPLGMMSGNGTLGLLVALIFAIPLAGLALVTPP